MITKLEIAGPLSAAEVKCGTVLTAPGGVLVIQCGRFWRHWFCLLGFKATVCLQPSRSDG